MSGTIQIRINGANHEVPAGLDVTGLLAHLGIASGRVAIERNFDILPRSQWAQTPVAAGDQFEIVHLVGGG